MTELLVALAVVYVLISFTITGVVVYFTNERGADSGWCWVTVLWPIGAIPVIAYFATKRYFAGRS